MSRFYYTDPLAAAWMMERHGMKLETADGKELAWFQGKIGFWQPFPLEGSDGGAVHGNRLLIESLDRHFIHPDSIHLLEPQVGDIVSVKNISEGWGAGVIESDRRSMTLDGESGDNWPYEGEPIIQRNGLAFHWPESEAA